MKVRSLENRFLADLIADQLNRHAADRFEVRYEARTISGRQWRIARVRRER